MKRKTIFCFVLVLGVLAACKTPPVNLDTAQGPVTCQLYTKDMVLWDKATSHPQGMNASVANAFCKQEGRRQKATG